MATERPSTPRPRRTSTTGSTGTGSRAKSTTGTTRAARTAPAAPAEAAEPATEETTPPQRRAPLAEVTRPLYAYVGAADLAVEKLRTLPTSALRTLPTTSLRDLPTTALRALPTTAPDMRRLSDRVGELTVEAAKVPTQVGTAVRGLPDTVSSLPGRAAHLYNTCADRGEKRVTEIRRAPTAEDAVTRTRTAVNRTRAAGSSARRAAGAAGRAAVSQTPLPRRGR
jgi:hypothetical protein